MDHLSKVEACSSKNQTFHLHFNLVNQIKLVDKIMKYPKEANLQAADLKKRKNKKSRKEE